MQYKYQLYWLRGETRPVILEVGLFDLSSETRASVSK